MRLRPLILALTLTLIATGPATAAEVSLQDGLLSYVAAPGEVNAVYGETDTTTGLGEDTSAFFLWEYTAELTFGPGCAPAPHPWGSSAVPPNLVLICAPVERVEVDLGDKDDEYTGWEALPVEVRAGEGDDFLYPGFGPNVLDGGPGNDKIAGGSGPDRISGGEGNDILEGDNGEPGGELGYPASAMDGDRVTGEDDLVDGGPGDDVVLGNGGADEIRGGTGIDSVLYPGRRRGVLLRLGSGADDGEPGERDNVAGNIEKIRTSPHPDTIIGTDAAEEFRTGRGDDVIDPGGGADRIEAGGGSDRISLRDGSPDTLICGTGVADAAVVDAVDLITADCESIERPSAAPRARTLLRVTGVRARTRDIEVTGRLEGPTSGCSGLTIRLVAVAGRRRVETDVPLRPDCRFSHRLRLRSRKVRVRAAFAGTDAWLPSQAR